MMFGRLVKNYKYLFFIIILGFFIRMAYIGRINFYFDEAGYASFAKHLAYEKISPWLEAAIQPPLFTWINSVFVQLFGINEVAMRLPSAIFGSLSIILVYLLANLWYERRIAIASALFFAIMPLHVIYSRLAFNDVIQTFFVLGAVVAAEYFFSRRKCSKRKFILISGTLFGLSYLVKYNCVVVWGLYWIFNLSYSIIKKDKRMFLNYFSYAALSSIVAGIVVVVVVFLGDGIPGVVYLINSTLFWASFQYSQIINPFYYYFAVLIESLSPLLYPALFFALSYCLLSKKSRRSDYLVIFLITAYLIVVSLQTRRFSKYLILITPFIAIILSNFILKIHDLIYKKSKTGAIIFVPAVAIFVLAWTVNEIKSPIEFDVWTKAGEFVHENYPDAKVHGSHHKNRLVRYYIQEGADNSEFIGTLKEKDLVVFTWLSNNSTIMENSPYEDESLLHTAKHTEYDKDFTDYVKKHGRLVKNFDYNKGTALWIYEITSTGSHKEDKVKEGYTVNSPIFGLWNILCRKWEDKSINTRMRNFLSKEQIDAIEKKCLPK